MYIEVLPSTVDALPEAVRQAAAPQGFAPLPPGIDEAEILRISRSFPLRSTHRQVQLQRQMEQPGSGLIGGHQSSFAAFQMMQSAQMAQAAVAIASAMHGQSGRPVQGELTNLQMLGAARKEPSARTSGLNALLDRAQSGALGTTEPTVSVETVPPVGPPSSGAKPLLALADAQSSAGVPDLSLPAASSEQLRPEQHVAVTESSLATGAPNTVVTATETGVAAEEVAADTVAPNQVEAAMVRLAKSYYDKDLSTEVADAKAGRKRPAAAKGRPRKRPAASEATTSSVQSPAAAPALSPAVLKRPASGKVDKIKITGKAASAKVRKRPAAKSAVATASKRHEVLQPVTQKQRMKLKPQGCATCRHTKGCCPSCWRKRGYRLV